jgi:hypothetical protein
MNPYSIEFLTSDWFLSITTYAGNHFAAAVISGLMFGYLLGFISQMFGRK